MPISLSTLKGMLDRPAHAYRPVVQTFMDLDVERIAGDLDLETRGQTRGAENQPLSEATTFDAVEAEIVETIGAAQKTAFDELENQLAGFRQRLIDLDFEARFAGIKDVAAGGLADLKAELQIGLDDLHGVRRDLTEAETYQTEFRKAHRLNRPSNINTPAGTVLKVMVLLVIMVAEFIANGYFLARGNELGLVGGVVQAIVFALLNVGVAVYIALYWLPFLTHRNLFAKLWGLIGLGVFLIWTSALNLSLAHFREVEGQLLGNAGTEVMTRLAERPFTLDEFQSWVLFGLGVFFSLVALIDGYSLRDSYPRYQKIADGVRQARSRYADMRRNRIEDLMDVRNDYQQTITDLRSDLSKRRTEHEAIVANRARQLSQFTEHQNQLEKAANVLLSRYRDANSAARSTPAPAHFAQSYKLNRVKVRLDRETEWNSSELQEAIKGAQADLEKVMETLGAQFDQTLDRYRELDRLAPES